MLRARDAQKLALAKHEVEEMLERAASTIKYRVILALSRRKQGFESPRERQSFQLVSPAQHLSTSIVRKIYGKDAAEL
jgi:hypothetical protein